MTQTMNITSNEALLAEYNQLEQEMLAMEDLIDLMTEIQQAYDAEVDLLDEDERRRVTDVIHELAQTTRVMPQMEARYLELEQIADFS